MPRQRIRVVGPTRAAALLGVGLLAVAGCGSDNPKDTASSGIEAGPSLYAANCASCHGRDLRGTNKGPSHLSVVYERNHHPDESFQRALEQGVRAHHWNFGDMPPVPGLDQTQIAAIVAYVRDMQDREGLDAYPPE